MITEKHFASQNDGGMPPKMTNCLKYQICDRKVNNKSLS